jgi:hypothetical protein
MKNFYLLLSLFFLASCSTAEENPEDDNPILVTKMTENSDIYTFSYNGAKIVNVNRGDGYKKVFTYNGDLITKYVETYPDNSTQTTNITYNSNAKILKKTSSYNGMTYTSDYTYMGADKVRIVLVASGSGTTKTYTRDAFLNSDGSLKNWTENVTEVVSPNTNTGTGVLQNIVYDGGSNPFKNVTGYYKLIESEDMSGSLRNVSKYDSRIQYNTGGTEWTIYQSTYDYNINGFPKKDTRDYFDKTGTSITKTDITTYEYNHL